MVNKETIGRPAGFGLSVQKVRTIDQGMSRKLDKFAPRHKVINLEETFQSMIVYQNGGNSKFRY